MARKPPKSPEQRLARWSRSMAPGTMNGRVASATPMTLDLTRLAPRVRTLAAGGSGTGDPETVHRVTSASTAQTIPDVTVATISYLTLTATSCAVTLPTAAAGKSLTVVLEQDASGGRLATWVNPSGSVKWAGGGAAPVLTVAGSQADVFTFLCYDGANYAAFIAGQNI